VGVLVFGCFSSGYLALGLRDDAAKRMLFFFNVRGKATWLLVNLDGIVEHPEFSTMYSDLGYW
jgi:hypothetical protein